jgi:hypothetical protein
MSTEPPKGITAPTPVEEVSGSAAILNWIFDKNRSYIGAVQPTEDVPPIEELEGRARCAELEKEAVAAAEAGDHAKALELLGQAMEACPQSGSPYNNRCQLRRLMSDAAGALEDASTAVELETAWLAGIPATGRVHPVAERHNGVLHKALLQRALLLKEAGDSEGYDRDLNAAAAAGSPLARTMLASSNPYATMCADAVARMMEAPASGHGK